MKNSFLILILFLFQFQIFAQIPNGDSVIGLGFYLDCNSDTSIVQIDDVIIEKTELEGMSTEIKYSNIAFAYTASSTIYNRFNADLVGWGWLPYPLSDENIELWKDKVIEENEKGVRFQARAELDAGWKNMLDFDPDGYYNDIVLTLEGDSLLIPWFSNLTHNGIKAYYFCTNSLGFRDFLRKQTEVIVEIGAQMMMLDGQTATPLAVKFYGGCFCEFCLSGFKQYLGEQYTVEELSELGVSDISTFNYQTFLIDAGWNDATYINENRKNVPNYPLSDDYRRYQYVSLQALTAELSNYADSLSGKHVPFSTSSPPDAPYRSVIIPEVDSYTGETYQGGDQAKLLTEPILHYKLAESLNKKMLLTGSPQKDWSPLEINDRPALIRLWIAQAYANSALFMTPVHMWAPLAPDGWYTSNWGNSDYIYNFIYDNAVLFDDYTPKSKASFLLPYKGLRYGKSRTKGTVRILTENNIPFNIIVAGDDWLEHELHDDDFINAEVILVNSDIEYLDEEQQVFLDQYADKVVEYDDLNSIFELTPRAFDVSIGNEKISIFPRENNINPEPTYVCHLINRDYDANSNEITVHNFEIIVDTSFFEEEIADAKLLRPGKDTVDLLLRVAENGFKVTILNLEEWGIIMFENGEADYVSSSYDFGISMNSLEIYPNPAKHYTYINIEEQSILMIIDINGRIVLEKNCFAGKNKINLEKLPSGVYLMRTNNNNSYSKGKLIIIP